MNEYGVYSESCVHDVITKYLNFTGHFYIFLLIIGVIDNDRMRAMNTTVYG